ncbi:hypothetical protein HYU07_02575 [Candidatus Woesearchaeota archaeon]|nr:hypothetical protein [Candidatus Woesearchaeota archaeon]
MNKKEEWSLIAKRDNVPLLPVWYKFEILAGQQAIKLYSTGVPGLQVWNKREYVCYFRTDEYRKAAEYVTQLLLSKKAYAHIKKLEQACKTAKHAASQATNISQLSDKQLINLHTKIIGMYKEMFLYGFITWCTQAIHSKALEILRKRRISGLETALSILIQPDKETPTTQRAKEISRLAKKYGKDPAKSQQLNKDIKAFIEKWGWVGYDYAGPLITTKEVLDEIRNTEAPKPAASKQKILSKLSKSEQQIFNVLSLIAYTKDLRNTSDDYVHFQLDKLYRELAKRHNCSSQDVRYLLPAELTKFIVNKKDVKLRQRFLLAYTWPLNSEFYTGVKARTLFSQSIQAESASKTTKILNGMAACAGKANGIARIIRKFPDLKKVKKGDILVASMTSPRYTGAIARAAAIITDEGGITSHAAIIAREMQKPCIIGTRIATKALKDGDLVEVDANKGIVRIL